MSQIICENVTLGYENKAVAENVNFKVEKGDYLCIVGENGSGKSTLIKAILGLHSPLHGKIVFGDGVKHNEIGYLPQQSAAQRDFPASVGEIAMSGFAGKCGLRPFYTKAEKQKANETLRKLGILELKNKCYRELSGGQQQRVLLARALCACSKILLLDEPVSGLDPKVTVDMYNLISELNRKDGITVIMISHDIAAAMKYATHILHIGKTVFFGTKSQYAMSDMGRLFDAAEGGDINA